jgi:hypothetical protein
VTFGRLVIRAQLTRPATIPDPRSILPYRDALVVNVYEITELIEGSYPQREIRVAQWAILDNRVLPDARKPAGTVSRLTVDRYDAHPELDGQRLISVDDNSRLPLYYDVTAGTDAAP